jgi:hypothetical protein
MLKIPAEYDSDTSSAKFTDISHQISPASLLDVWAGYCQTALVSESGMIRTQMRKHERSVMTAVYGTPWPIPPPQTVTVRIPDIDTRWRWVMSFTFRPLYCQGNRPWYPLDRGLVDPRASMDGIVTNKSLPYRDQNPGHTAWNLVTALTALSPYVRACVSRNSVPS